MNFLKIVGLFHLILNLFQKEWAFLVKDWETLENKEFNDNNSNDYEFNYTLVISGPNAIPTPRLFGNLPQESQGSLHRISQKTPS